MKIIDIPSITKLSNFFGIPYRTVYRWKHSEGWRRRLYELLVKEYIRQNRGQQ